MDIKLINFRYHEEFECSFKSEEICLIQGISGIGKSTIFEAIYWCLFGKLQKIAPINWDVQTQRKNKTTVKLVFVSLGIKIVRQTNSNILTLKLLNSSMKPKSSKGKSKSKILEDTAAQEYINNIFGSSDFWLTTSYLRQKQMNKFLTGGTSEKLELINTMAFQDENPSKYIETVDMELKINEKSLLKLEMKHEITIDTFKSKLKKYNLSEKSLKSTTNIKTLESTIETNESKIRDLKKEISDHESQTLEIESLKKKIGTQSKESLESLINSHRNDIEIIKSSSNLITLQKSYRNLLKKISELEGKLKKSPKRTSKISRKGKFTSKEISEAESSTEKYRNNVSRAESLNVEYLKSKVSGEISELKEKISSYEESQEKFQRFQRRVQEIKKLDQEIDHIRELISQTQRKIQEIPPFTEMNSIKKSILELKDKITKLNSKLKKYKNFESDPDFSKLKQILKDPPLECPKCNCNLKYNPQSKILTTVENFDREEILQKIKDLETLYLEQTREITGKINVEKEILKKFSGDLQILENLHDKFRKLQLTLKSHERTLSENLDDRSKLKPLELISIDPKSIDINSIRKRFHLLSEIKFYTKPEFTVDDMLIFNENVEVRELERELNSLRENLSSYNQESMETEIKLPRFTISELKEKITGLEKIGILLDKVNLLQSSLLEINSEKIESSIDDLKKKNKKLIEEIKISRIKEDLREIQKEIKPRKKEIRLLKKKISNLGKLRQLFIDAEYASYEKVAERINMFLEDIVSELFIDPIKIKISMFKKLKTKDRIKPVVNLTVFHRDNEIDLGIMSGGEKDRISVAITLAMMKMSKSPIVLIDETLGSLSKSDRERAMKVFSKYGKKSKKTFLCIGQCDKSKWYDRELNISTI